MRILAPASRASFKLRFSLIDVLWAAGSPWLALWIRGAWVLSADDWPTAALYCGITCATSLIAFLVFRIREGMTSLFSVHDALEVAKAVLLSEFVTCLVLFSATRLEGIPRSTPLIHALLLAAGLIVARAAVRMIHPDRDLPAPSDGRDTEHIIIIGSNRLSALYIDLLHAYAPERHHIIALLDDRPEMIGRSIAGVRVLGPSSDLESVIAEFKEHGIRTDRLIIGGDTDYLSAEALAEITRVCNEQDARLDFVPQLIGLDAVREADAGQAARPETSVPVSLPLPRYHVAKRVIDFTVALLLIILLLPVFIAIAAIVVLDVGTPVFFWQRRTGINGRIFQMHKFRTLKPAYDWRGLPVATTERMSFIGDILRRNRVDELPQLLNVLVGDMSLVGPRPLLPRDQPADPTVRLKVRPGMTGWAQVNGGTLLSSEEKRTLDEWYVRNASLWLDLKIMAMTLLFLARGEGQHDVGATASPMPQRGDRLA
jgi:lipopolysaccharide/colanic/teichoic acid biosynthesis glycosyltransferase